MWGGRFNIGAHLHFYENLIFRGDSLVYPSPERLPGKMSSGRSLVDLSKNRQKVEKIIFIFYCEIGFSIYESSAHLKSDLKKLFI